MLHKFAIAIALRLSSLPSSLCQQPMLDKFPAGTKYLFMNIGTNLEPVLPPQRNKSIAAVGFEPIVHGKVRQHEGLFMIPAAVSDYSGVAMMNIWNKDGASSSLSQLTSESQSVILRERKGSLPVMMSVPVISMTSVMQSVPDELTIWFLKTDMQGHDFAALSSCGALLRRIDWIMAEVYTHSNLSEATYVSASNRYCEDFVPHMASIGFLPWGVTTHRPHAAIHHFGKSQQAADEWCRQDFARKINARETNGYWVRNDSKLPPPPAGEAF